jgi:hypothetical protein
MPGEHTSTQAPLIPIYPSFVTCGTRECHLETNTNHPDCKQWQLLQISKSELSFASRYFTVCYELLNSLVMGMLSTRETVPGNITDFVISATHTARDTYPAIWIFTFKFALV